MTTTIVVILAVALALLRLIPAGSPPMSDAAPVAGTFDTPIQAYQSTRAELAAAKAQYAAANTAYASARAELSAAISALGRPVFGTQPDGSVTVYTVGPNGLWTAVALPPTTPLPAPPAA